MGELWNAHAPTRVHMGEHVVVRKVDGLELEVESAGNWETLDSFAKRQQEEKHDACRNHCGCRRAEATFLRRPDRAGAEGGS